MNDLYQNSRKFKGIRLPAQYNEILKEAVEQDARDPEEQNQPEIQNRLKKFGQTPEAYNG